jgi:hypothetical protein
MVGLFLVIWAEAILWFITEPLIFNSFIFSVFTYLTRFPHDKTARPHCGGFPEACLVARLYSRPL